MLLAEWSRLSIGFAEAQGRIIGHDPILRALRWISPERDTATVRRIASRLIETGRPIHCVWSGARLTDFRSIEIDHCFPYSAWPCDDLWNLLPASRQANGGKSDRLVSDSALSRAGELIQNWWLTAYRDLENLALSRQFGEEARATLPLDTPSDFATVRAPGLEDVEFDRSWHGEMEASTDLDGVFAAVRYQRLRLRQDQNLREWDGIGR
jgi:hypothetical protein